MPPSVEQGRAAFARGAWGDAFAVLKATAARLDAGDHERLAVSAYLIGADDDCVRAWEAAHRTALEADDPIHAARCGFWLAFSFMMGGQMAQAGAWLGRTRSLIAERQLDCAAEGFLLIPEVLGALEDDPARARDLAVRAHDIGHRFNDADLLAFAVLAHGQSLLALGEITAGLARLDDVMLSVTGGDVGPITTGIVYCAVVLECMKLFDVQRASEWTAALSAWCDAQPDLVPYRGQCLVHRSQLQQAAGDWSVAIKTAAAACVRLTDPPHPALGLAYYQEGELHRLVGDFDAADASYRRAGRHGRQPMPGLALLELVRGHAATAAASIQRALQEPGHPLDRAGLLAAAVEILRVSGDRDAARTAADELAAIAATSASSPMLHALAHHATGSVLLAEGDPVAALSELRTAAEAWRALQMPYEAGRTAVLVGLACAALGDRVAADLEFENARDTFTELGAAPELQRLAALSGDAAAATTEARDARLSAREREVLALVAAGKTNREIATALTISQHTAGRHVENIFTKLGVSSRAAATAYAYEHDLLR